MHAGDTDVRVPEEPGDADALLSRISSWVDTRYSVRKVLEHWGPDAARDADTFLSDRANRRFLELHADMAEEGGPGERQHSWAAVETRREVVMCGPYYPDYGRGEHSEDRAVRQTEELLATEGVRALGSDVFIFTRSSPCLDRDTQPCMLHLVEKALEWHALYGVRTHIGYARSWGFKGNKEALFREVDFQQLECVGLSHDHDSYVEAMAKNCPEGNLGPLSKDLFGAVKRMLDAGSKGLRFSLKPATQEPNRKSCFKSVESCVSECEEGGASEEERKAETKEADAMAEAAQELVSEGTLQNLREHVERGLTFARDYGFSSQTDETAGAEVRQAFVRGWRDMAEGRYAEVIRERLTDDFNRHVTHLFSQDVVKLDKEYIQIGRIRFSEGSLPSLEDR
ncbi:hypothetical protein NHX12_026506 [Muraenolepis orangiensis]|uniref:Uncharacterized protein n=1 Tax=Muraenolepis orangiensis TaxID=630683 RepID=A0A9Q0EJN0_9TELE|nr:hypothetical protein NHX12_026506 [Muraenolepis orangiensis]